MIKLSVASSFKQFLKSLGPGVTLTGSESGRLNVSDFTPALSTHFDSLDAEEDEEDAAPYQPVEADVAVDEEVVYSLLTQLDFFVFHLSLSCVFHLSSTVWLINLSPSSSNLKILTSFTMCDEFS